MNSHYILNFCNVRIKNKANTQVNIYGYKCTFELLPSRCWTQEERIKCGGNLLLRRRWTLWTMKSESPYESVNKTWGHPTPLYRVTFMWPWEINISVTWFLFCASYVCVPSPDRQLYICWYLLVSSIFDNFSSFIILGLFVVLKHRFRAVELCFEVAISSHICTYCWSSISVGVFIYSWLSISENYLLLVDFESY